MKQENNKVYVPGSCGEPEYFTPTSEEQILLKLQGKCTHTYGWRYQGHGHNDDMWLCLKCWETKCH